jgi:hypothetical protein
MTGFAIFFCTAVLSALTTRLSDGIKTGDAKSDTESTAARILLLLKKQNFFINPPKFLYKSMLLVHVLPNTYYIIAYYLRIGIKHPVIDANSIIQCRNNDLLKY